MARGTPLVDARPPPPLRKVTITAVFFGGFVLILGQLMIETELLPLGFPTPSYVAGALSIVIAIALTAPAVRWLGGKRAVDVVVKHDAAIGALQYEGPMREAMERVGREGMSARDQRIMFAFMFFFPVFGVLMGLADAVNRAFASAPVEVPCRVAKQTRKPDASRIDVRIACTLPDGEARHAHAFYDTEVTDPSVERKVPVRPGALGVWLVPRSAFASAGNPTP